MKRIIFLFTILYSFFPKNPLIAQKNFTLSGYIKDARTNETLIGASVYNKAKTLQGSTANAYGFYSLTLPSGKYTLVYSFIGYANQEIEVDLNANKELNIALTEGVEMKEVVVTAKQEDRNVTTTEMGTITLPIETVKKLPALMGEVDVMKVLQLMPGVKGSEGGTGFYVRGGGPDQNLVLLDEAVVYNPGHLFGFFSVFNGDAIKNTTLIKGNLPANYGGRLSSVVDIQMKEGNNRAFSVDGGIGAIASRLTIEGPIQQEKSSFIFSTRRTYFLDLLQPFLKGGRFEGTNYYFYDMNMKVNYQFSDKDRLFLSGYFGRDVFAINVQDRGLNFSLPYGNSTATVRWNHVYNQKLFSNLSLVYNAYNFEASGGQDIFRFSSSSGVRDWNAKIDFEYFPNYQHTLKTGVNYTFHTLTPNVIRAQVGDIEFKNNLTPKYAHDVAAYVNDDWKISDALTLSMGLRGGFFTQVGNYTSSLTGRTYASGEPVVTYPFLEPRINGKWSLGKTSSLKFGFTYANQFIHLVSNSTSTLPADVWVPSSERVRPQVGTQYALGYFRNFADNMFETSVEIYYRDLKNQIDYPDSYVNNVSRDVEQDFVFGKGMAYGAEFFIRKNKGRLTGWIGYTWSRTLRSFPDIEGGRWYPATYDRINDMSVVLSYNISKKWDITGTFVYYTGNTYTPLAYLYLIDGRFNQAYAPRNSSRLPNYHRVDLAAVYTPHPERTDRKFSSSWTFGLYNAYNQLNPFFIYYNIENNFERGTAKANAYKVTIFPIIPSVTWNFKWRQKPTNK